jgi:hypothetical protein
MRHNTRVAGVGKKKQKKRKRNGESRKESVLYLRCRCLTGLGDTVDKHAVKLLQDMRVNTGPQPTNGLGDIAMFSQMRST